MFGGHRGFFLAFLVTSAAGLGCNQAPTLAALGDQVATVDTVFTLTLAASDPDGDTLQFSFTADISDISNRAAIEPSGPGMAVFRFTPIISDVGIHAFDFAASDGSDTARQTISIEVKPSAGGAPIFRQPLGTGTTLDLAQKKCGSISIVVEDPDSAEVNLTQEEPLIAEAILSQKSGLTAEWKWCPTDAQIAGDDRYMLRLAADDGTNQTTKDYLIVLRKPQNPSCPGPAPVVAHEPQNETTVVGLSIFAQISDDQGIKGEPLLYYSTTAPSTPPDLMQMTQVVMILIDGSSQDGIWGADVPNPAAGLPAGSSADLYYVIVAEDDDDSTGSCDHVTQAPPGTDSYHTLITNPGGQGNLGVCEACSADLQCGGAADNCVPIGGAGFTYCGRTCSTDGECPTDYYCSITELQSVDGVATHQCLPNSGSCTVAVCADDALEENDTRADAMNNPGIVPATYTELKSCSADEDWYPFDLAEDTLVTVTISGGGSTDLDLALVTSSGTVLQRSDSLSSAESVSQCVGAGTYLIRVYSWESGENSYSMTFSAVSQSCG